MCSEGMLAECWHTGSTLMAAIFGKYSVRIRYFSEACRTIAEGSRTLLEALSNKRRSAAEGQSNNGRSNPESVSNQSRTSLEPVPNYSRSSLEGHSNSFATRRRICKKRCSFLPNKIAV